MKNILKSSEFKAVKFFGKGAIISTLIFLAFFGIIKFAENYLTIFMIIIGIFIWILFTLLLSVLVEAISWNL